jgi:hypothetical protein
MRIEKSFSVSEKAATGAVPVPVPVGTVAKRVEDILSGNETDIDPAHECADRVAAEQEYQFGTM